MKLQKSKQKQSVYLISAALQDHISRQLFTLPKLQQNPNKLTLAQKLGLVPSPPKPLSNDEWKQIEQQSIKRDNIADCVCPICLECFKMQEHIILSCSHIFHKVCLDSFEKISKMKQCPICRKQDYERKQYIQANKQYKLQAILKIQTYHRGYRARVRFYEKMIQMGYKPNTQSLKRKLILYKLARVSLKMSKNISKQNQNAQLAIENLNNNLKQKQEQMEENMIKIRMMKMQNQEEKNAVTMLKNVVDWPKVRQSALERKETECTICYQNMVNTKVYLLNCTHMFHANCINSFERYQLGQIHHCPLCRTQYQKQHFVLKQ